MSHLNCKFVFNSAHQHVDPPSSGFAVDLARDPSSAHQLIKLGISPRKDLPAVLLTDAGGKLRVMGLRLSEQEADELIRGRVPESDRLLMFSATWCQNCRRAKQMLDEAGIAYEEIDLDTDLMAEALVIERSGGRRVVPTLRFDERIFVFNPDPGLLHRLLDSVAADA